MIRLLLLPVILLCAHPAVANQAAWQERRAQCMGWLMAGGYPSGLEEKACARDFALPSAFLFKCARAQSLGFASDQQQAACVAFFARAAETAQDGYVIR